MLDSKEKFMSEDEKYEPVTRITLTYGATWKIAWAVMMGNILTGLVIGGFYVLFHK
jgi:hypothetical protein